MQKLFTFAAILSFFMIVPFAHAQSSQSGQLVEPAAYTNIPYSAYASTGSDILGDALVIAGITSIAVGLYAATPKKRS